MLKNVTFKELITSKTVWAGIIAFVPQAFHAVGQWTSGAKASAVATFGTALATLLAAVGIKDATSGPVN
jgi:hypothetical protein